MLGEMSAIEWLEWQVYMGLAPFAEERADLRASYVVQTLMNVNRDPKKRRRPYKLADAALLFGDTPDPTKRTITRTQTPEQQSEILRAMFNVEGLEQFRKVKKKPNEAGTRTDLDVVATGGGKATTETIRRK